MSGYKWGAGDWTDEQKAHALLLRSRGRSNIEIATDDRMRELRPGVTGRAVGGILNRMQGAGAHVVSQRLSTMPKKQKVRVFGNKKATQAPWVPPAEVITTVAEGVDAFRLEDLSSAQCRWPIKQDNGGFVFCCRKTKDAKSPYCEEHHRISKNKDQPKREPKAWD